MTRTLALAVALALSLPAAAQTVVEGRLAEPDGAPRAGVLLAAVSGLAGPGVADSARTDADGRFRLALAADAYGLGVGGFWVPLVLAATDAPAVQLDLRLASDASRVERPATFAATGSDPVVAELMALYARAERWHRTPVDSDEMDSFAARAGALLDAAPAERREALRDSLGRVADDIRQRAVAGRLDAFYAGLDGAAHDLVRQGYALWGLDKVDADAAAAARLFETVPADSPLWTFEATSQVGVSNALARMTGGLGDRDPAEVGPYLRRIAYDHPDPNVRLQGATVYYRYLEDAGDENGARAARDRLAREFPDSRQAESIRRTHSPDRRVRPGQPVPDFSFPTLDDPAVSVTAQDLRGSTVLLDFWGTWCGPCVQAMPRLHEVYQAYRDRGFEILSVAIDDTAESVAAFRADRFPMPWRHALHPEGTTSEAGALLEFNAVPAYVLVDPDGVVIAEAEGPFGDVIEGALADHFGAAAPAGR